MKVIVQAITALLLAPSAWAASPFLPISDTNTFASAQRTQVEAAIAQAETGGKAVIVDVAAAWCGPCLGLQIDMEKHKADPDFKAIMDQFVLVRVEEMHIETISEMDFVPMEVSSFPSLYLYDPKTKVWSFVQANSAEQLGGTLGLYLQNNRSIAIPFDGEIRKEISEGSPQKQVAFGILQVAMMATATENSGADLMVFVGEILKALALHPENFDFARSDFETLMQDVYMHAMEQGKLTLAQAQAGDELAFPTAKTDATVVYQLNFSLPLGILLRTQGNKAASDQCDALANSVLGMVGSDAAQIHRIQLFSDVQCLLLAVQVQDKGANDVRAFAASLTDDEVGTLLTPMMILYAATGETYDKAGELAQTWKKAKLAGFSNGIQQTKDAIAKETDAEKLKKLNGRLAVLQMLNDRVVAATDARIAAYAAGKSNP